METPPACEEESGPVTTSATPETVSTHHLPRRLALPDFPWDSLTPYRERAAQHPDGVVDLAVGTPVDPRGERVAVSTPKTQGCRTAITSLPRRECHR